MTSKQYKNIINFTILEQKNSGQGDSVAIIKKVMDNCGTAFPDGDRLRVLSLLSSGQYVGWQSCSVQEAQAAANSGIAAVGIGNTRSVVVEPEEDEMLAGVMVENTCYSATVASLSAEDVEEMAFFAPAVFETSENGEIMATAATSTTTYVVWYYLNYVGAGSAYHVLKQHNHDLTLGWPDREGYVFCGWALSPNGEVVYKGGEKYTVNEGANLYAVWSLHYFDFKDGVEISDATIREQALCAMDKHYKENKSSLQAHIDDGKTCIFAFEGLGQCYGGTSDCHPKPYKFLTAMMLVTWGHKIVYVTRRASTLPDIPPESEGAATTLKEGVYDYRKGFHRSQYAALFPKYSNDEKTWPGWYFDDINGFYCGACIGINLHATGENPSEQNSHSLGCQTVYVKDYLDFGKAVGFLDPDVNGNPSSNGYTKELAKIIGEGNNNSIDVDVKYILDRSYDQKNTAGNENGVFYPVSHTHNTKCVS